MFIREMKVKHVHVRQHQRNIPRYAGMIAVGIKRPELI